MALQGPDLELGLVFFQDALVVVFPKLGRCIFSTNSLQDLLAAGVLVRKLCAGASVCVSLLILRIQTEGTNLGNVVDIALDDDPQRIGLFVLSYFGRLENL